MAGQTITLGVVFNSKELVKVPYLKHDLISRMFYTMHTNTQFGQTVLNLVQELFIITTVL
jgi:hypothetical protein